MLLLPGRQHVLLGALFAELAISLAVVFSLESGRLPRRTRKSGGRCHNNARQDVQEEDDRTME